MKSKLFLCAALAAALYVTPSYAADYSAQVVSFCSGGPGQPLHRADRLQSNYRRFLHSNFHPSHFRDSSWFRAGIPTRYMKKQPMKPTEADFSSAFSHLRTRITTILNGCTILGFCGNKLFILDPHYDEQYASDSEEYAKCKEIVTSIKKSFISYIKDAGTVE